MFIFKKIISQFLFPLPLVLILSLAGWYFLICTKKQKAGKVLFSISLIVLIITSNSIIPDRLILNLENKYKPHDIQFSDKTFTSENPQFIQYTVVLAGGHRDNADFPVTSQIGPYTLVRLIEGIRIHRKYPGSKLILSGGSVNTIVTEAALMASIAKELGVNEKDIIIEDKSRDTKDEAKYLKKILNNIPFILVTSATHMPRSVALFQKLGMNPLPAPTGHIANGNQEISIPSFLPDTNNLYKSKRVIYEYLGMAWSFLRGQI